MYVVLLELKKLIEIVQLSPLCEMMLSNLKYLKRRSVKIIQRSESKK